jgi:glutamate synthase domain-containing protein 1
MEHRGACGADSDSGDGAGMMTQIPWELFKSMVSGDDIKKTGVGMMFLPQDDAKRKTAKEAIEGVAKANGLKVLGWREVPVNKDVLGELARDVVPTMEQIVLQSEQGLTGDELEQQLYVVMRSVQTAVAAKGLDWDRVRPLAAPVRTRVWQRGAERRGRGRRTASTPAPCPAALSSTRAWCVPPAQPLRGAADAQAVRAD